MTILTRCNNLEEAHLMASRLQSEGIEATVPDELTVAPYGEVGGVRVWVPDEDLDAARQILGLKASQG